MATRDIYIREYICDGCGGILRTKNDGPKPNGYYLDVEWVRSSVPSTTVKMTVFACEESCIVSAIANINAGRILPRDVVPSHQAEAERNATFLGMLD